jgi:very-short-patch-repair endonuclease
MRNRSLVNTVKQRITRQLLRNNQTDSEVILWQYLRGKELGLKFVKQYGIQNYIADFCCRSKKLIIEIDGSIHDQKEAKENDEERTKYLESLGYKIIRFTNSEVLNDLETVLNKIKIHLK